MTAQLPSPQAVGAAETGVRRAAVIGAGSMGSGIAAQFANAGIPVDLLDIPGTPRNAGAEAGIARQLKVGGFMHPDAAALVRPGNTEDDLARLAEADWIVEAVIEETEAKRELFLRIEPYRRPGTVISSNTSTIPRAKLVDGMPEGFARDFVVTHFFNPPRVMHLVELVTGPETTPATVARVRAGAEAVLGKTVVDCFDTPGFIANRIGCYWNACGILEAKRLGLTIEEADAVNAALGIPKIGVFGCLDLVGLDLVASVWTSLMAALPATDDLQRFDLTQDPLIHKLVAEGRHGRKTKAGFYRKAPDGSMEITDLVSGDYRSAAVVNLPGKGRDLGALLADPGRIGAYAIGLVADVVAYAATHGAAIAADVGAVDTAMQLGYGWKHGPFGIADRVGPARIAQHLRDTGRAIPALLEQAQTQGGFFDASGVPLTTSGRTRAVQPAAPHALLTRARLSGAPILGNDFATLWDLGDGIACFEMRSKLNCLDPGVFDLLEEVLTRGDASFRGLVLGNDHPRAFSVGADLAFFTGMIRGKEFASLDRYVARGQGLFLALKRAPFPVVAAVHGLALGGGCEFSLHSDAVLAHAELTMPLPEVKVGLVPAWGGCTQLLLRSQQSGIGPRGSVAVARPAFETILGGVFSSSAADARSRGFLRPTDGIVMNRAHLLAHARDRAVTLAKNYVAPEPALIGVAGPSGRLELMASVRAQAAAGTLTDTDLHLADCLATVLTGGAQGDPTRPLTEAAMMALEREAVVDLAQRPTTQARIDHMLATGKPLRN